MNSQGERLQNYDYRQLSPEALSSLTTNYNHNNDADTFVEAPVIQKTAIELMTTPSFVVALACFGMSIFVMFLYLYRLLVKLRDKARVKRLANEAVKSAKKYRKAVRDEARKACADGDTNDRSDLESTDSNDEAATQKPKKQLPKTLAEKELEELWSLAEDRMSEVKRETRTMAAVIEKHRATILALEEALAERQSEECGRSMPPMAKAESVGSLSNNPTPTGNDTNGSTPSRGVGAHSTPPQISPQVSPHRGKYVSDGRTTSQLTADVFGYSTMTEAERKAHDEKFRKCETKVLWARQKQRRKENADSLAKAKRGEKTPEAEKVLDAAVERTILESVLSKPEITFWEENIKKIRDFQAVLRSEAASQWVRRKEIISAIQALEAEAGADAMSPKVNVEAIRKRLSLEPKSKNEQEMGKVSADHNRQRNREVQKIINELESDCT